MHRILCSFILLAAWLPAGSLLRAADSTAAATRPVMTLSGSAGKILSLGVSADGKRAVALADDNSLREWSLEDGKPLLKVDVESLNLDKYDSMHGEKPITAVGETRDGKYIVLGGGNFAVQIRDRVTGALVKVLVPHENDCYLSGDGMTAAISAFGWTTCVSLPDGGAEGRFPTGQPNAELVSVSLSENGDVLLMTDPSAESCMLYRPASGQLTKKLGPYEDASSAQLSPDGNKIAIEYDMGFGVFAPGGLGPMPVSITLIDAGTGAKTRVQMMAYCDGSAPPMIFSPDSKMLAVATARTVVKVDVATGQVAGSYMPDDLQPAERTTAGQIAARQYWAPRSPTALAFTPDGKRLLVAAGDDIQVCDDSKTYPSKDQPGSR